MAAFFAAFVVAIMYPEILLQPQVRFGLTPLAVLFLFAAVTFMWYSIPRIHNLTIQPFDIMFLLALAYTAARAIAATRAHIEIRFAIEYTGYALIAYYGAALLFRGPGQAKSFILLLVGCMMIVSLYEIFTYLIGFDPIYGTKISQILPLKDANYYRGGSTLGHPIYLGAFLLQAAPFAVWVMVSERSKKLRRMGLVALLLAVIAGILSFSKGAWIVGGVLAAALVLVERRSIRKDLLVGAALAVSIIILGLAVRGDLVFQLFNRQQDPYFGREWSWNQAIDMFSENRAFGVGLSRGMEELYHRTGQNNGFFFPIDNYYLSALVEEGIVGSLLYGAVLAMVALGAYRIIRRPPPAERILSLMIVFSLLGILADSFIFDAFLVWPNFLLFWTVCGLMRASEERRRANRPVDFIGDGSYA